MFQRIRQSVKLGSRIGLILSIMTSLPIMRRVFHFDYLFFTYAGSSGDRKAYGPKWFVNLFPSIVPAGLLNRGDNVGYGLLLGTAEPAKSFEAPARVAQMMRTLDRWHRKFNTKSIALGGQLPSILHRNGTPIKPPLLAGQYGTVYILHLLIDALAQKSDVDRRSLSIGVLGVGFIGTALVNFLATLFDHVIAVDTRKAQTSDQWPANVTYTNSMKRLSQCDLVVILTGSGDDAAAAIPCLKDGVIVIDDAHPQMSRRYVRQIRAQKGGKVYKAAVGLEHVRFIPRLPGFEPDWIPGCAIEAIVSSKFGFDYQDQTEFNAKADQMGFYPLMVSHRND